MSRPSLLVRHLAVVWRRDGVTRAYVTELVTLVGLLVAQYIVFWSSFPGTLASYPWLPLALIVPLYPRLAIEMRHDGVRMRWWLGPFPLPFGGHKVMTPGGRFECEESSDGNDAWTVEYSEGGLFVFAPYPSRLASALNAELKRVGEGSMSDDAPRARVVKDASQEHDA